MHVYWKEKQKHITLGENITFETIGCSRLMKKFQTIKYFLLVIPNKIKVKSYLFLDNTSLLEQQQREH